MGIYVHLYVFPQRIPELEWDQAFDEAVRLAQAFTPPLVALRKRQRHGVELLVYSRQILNEDGNELRLYGDAETREYAEDFRLPRQRPSPIRLDLPDDVDIVTVDEHQLASVFDGKTQGYGYHTAVVALAALFESRFPQGALASGDLDRAACEKAVGWANTVLDSPARLPVCVNPAALSTRLRAALPREEVRARFRHLFRGSETEAWQAHVAHLADIERPEDALATALRGEDATVRTGHLLTVRAWLNATSDLPTLVRAASLHPAGPGWPLASLLSALGLTWVLLDAGETARLGGYHAQGVVGAVLGVFGAFYPEFGLGRMLSCYRPGFDETVRVVAETLQLSEESVRHEARRLLERERERLRAMEERAAEEIARPLVEGAGEPNGPEMGAQARESAGSLGRDLAAMGIPLDADHLHRAIAAAAAETRLALTEDAWALLDAEDDVDVLLVILSLMAAGFAPGGARDALVTALETGAYELLTHKGTQ